MANDSNSATTPSTSRTITHNKRDKASDVNPLLQSSSEIIVSADDNFIVGRQKGGQLHNIVPGFKLSFKDNWFNGIEKYYEVDKRSYPFVVPFDGMASAQATFKFNVSLEFTLQVVDPCAVVKENYTSLLDCILLDLKRSVYDITSRFLVQKTDEARMSLQTALMSFNCPPFLKMNCGVVDIMADAAATKMLRELEQKNLEMALIGKKTEIDSAMALSSKVTEVYTNNVEEHEIQKHLPGLMGKVLPNETVG
jgi:hypothetical protein